MVLVGHRLDSIYEISDYAPYLEGGRQLDYGRTLTYFNGNTRMYVCSCEIMFSGLDAVIVPPRQGARCPNRRS